MCRARDARDRRAPGSELRRRRSACQAVLAGDRQQLFRGFRGAAAADRFPRPGRRSRRARAERLEMADLRGGGPDNDQCFACIYCRIGASRRSPTPCDGFGRRDPQGKRSRKPTWTRERERHARDAARREKPLSKPLYAAKRAFRAKKHGENRGARCSPEKAIYRYIHVFIWISLYPFAPGNGAPVSSAQ